MVSGKNLHKVKQWLVFGKYSMSLSNIKTEVLIIELIDRMADQILDPDPMYDGILSYVEKQDLETVMDDLQGLLGNRKRNECR